jgi:hypothetical protein
VEATLSPHRAVVLPSAPAEATRLPASRNCSDAMQSLVKGAGAVADAGMLRISIRAARRVQVRIDQVTARVVTEPASRFRAWARCGTSDWRERNTDDGERYGARQDVVIKEVEHGVPWITAAGLLSKVEYDGYFYGPPRLADTPLDLSPDVSQILPMYLSNTDPALRQGFLINVYLTVNGKQYAVTVTDAGGSPFWVYGTGATDQNTPAVEYLEDTGKWVPGRAFDDDEVAERAVPRGRACEVLRPGELEPLLGKPVWADGGGDSCSWRNPESDGTLSLNLRREETEDLALENFRNRVATLPITYQDDRIIHVADVGDEAVAINGFVLAHAGTEYAEFTFGGDSPMDQSYLAAVQAAARRLWPAAPTPADARIGPYVGKWQVHGMTFTVRPDGTAEAVWNAGPCSDDLNETRMCTGKADIDLTVRPHFASATTSRVSYQDEQGRPAEGLGTDSSAPVVGDTVYLHHVRDNVMLRLGGLDGADGNPYLCGPGITDDFWTRRCGG